MNVCRCLVFRRANYTYTWAYIIWKVWTHSEERYPPGPGPPSYQHRRLAVSLLSEWFTIRKVILMYRPSSSMHHTTKQSHIITSFESQEQAPVTMTTTTNHCRKAYCVFGTGLSVQQTLHWPPNIVQPLWWCTDGRYSRPTRERLLCKWFLQLRLALGIVSRYCKGIDGFKPGGCIYLSNNSNVTGMEVHLLIDNITMDMVKYRNIL